MMHLACFIDPSKLKIAVLCSADRLGDWEWVKWMPQARSSIVRDAVGPGRMISTDPRELAEMIGPDIAMRGAYRPGDDMPEWPHLLLVCDGAEFPPQLPLRFGGGRARRDDHVPRPRVDAHEVAHSAAPRHPPQPESQGRGRRRVVTMDSVPESAFADRLSAVQAEAWHVA